MDPRLPTVTLPSIPAKRYFTIGEVSELCAVKPHVLRYWEQEFTQLRPMKRRGNRRYYQHHEVLLIRKIRELLYDQGFTISGARNQLHDTRARGADLPLETTSMSSAHGLLVPGDMGPIPSVISKSETDAMNGSTEPRVADVHSQELRRSLTELLDLLRRPSGRSS
jgi:DNA-binding transcriptional MerR regulator